MKSEKRSTPVVNYTYTQEQTQCLKKLIQALRLCEQESAGLLSSIPVRTSREAKIFASHLAVKSGIEYLVSIDIETKEKEHKPFKRRSR